MGRVSALTQEHIDTARATLDSFLASPHAYALSNAEELIAQLEAVVGSLAVDGRADVDALRAGELPPTFYVYGTEDPFYGQFEAQSELLRDEVGVPVRRLVLQDWPHGFGGDGGWVEDYAQWLEQVFSLN